MKCVLLLLVAIRASTIAWGAHAHSAEPSFCEGSGCNATAQDSHPRDSPTVLGRHETGGSPDEHQQDISQQLLAAQARAAEAESRAAVAEARADVAEADAAEARATAAEACAIAAEARADTLQQQTARFHASDGIDALCAATSRRRLLTTTSAPTPAPTPTPTVVPTPGPTASPLPTTVDVTTFNQ